MAAPGQMEEQEFAAPVEVSAAEKAARREKLKKGSFVQSASTALNNRFTDMFKAFQYVGLDRSGTLADGGGYYFQSIRPAVRGPSDYLRLMHVLAQDVGVIGLFSDWPATVSFYASCTGRR